MPEQIGVFVVFLLVVLFNLIVQLLQRRRRAARSAGETVEAPPAPPPRPPRVPRVVVAPPRLEEAPPAAIHIAPPVRAAPVRRRRRFDLRPRNLRRAVVLMTVLGPCRALEDERGVAGRP
ncbi:MAG TPA: hypothetical protein VF010_02205 [Methylomirabilota bacterium]|nr:hypothetical protein [Methylomirabilota bacterium]